MVSTSGDLKHFGRSQQHIHQSYIHLFTFNLRDFQKINLISKVTNLEYRAPFEVVLLLLLLYIFLTVRQLVSRAKCFKNEKGILFVKERGRYII